MEKNQILVIVALAIIVVTGGLIFLSQNSGSINMPFGTSAEKVAKLAVDNLNNNILQGQTATMESYSKESGVVKIKLDINGQKYESYATSDGKLFFPEAIAIEASKGSNDNGTATKEFTITKENHVKGNFEAPVTLVEFSDFECPFCKSFLPTLNKILTDYKDSVRLVYKHYPLSNIHPNAQKAAEASECAAEQGKFWEMHDKLFANQSSLNEQNYKKWAVELGLSAGQFNNCLDSSKYADKVAADTSEASSKGVNGTPATFVNGKLVSGAVPYDQIKKEIDAALNK